MKEKPIIQLSNIYSKSSDELLESHISIKWNEFFIPFKEPNLNKEFNELYPKLEICNFIKALQYEFGLNNVKKDLQKAFKIYKQSADNDNDILSMYRLYEIYLEDYQKFKVKPDRIIEKYYLFKCFAYTPYFLIRNSLNIFGKIPIMDEMNLQFNIEDKEYTKFNKMLNILSNNLKDDKIKKSYPFVKEEDIIIIRALFAHLFTNLDDNDNEYIDYIESLEMLCFSNNNKECLYKMACISIDNKNYEMAESLFERCINLNYLKSYSEYIGYLFDIKKNFKKALFHLENAVKNNDYRSYSSYVGVYLHENYFSIFETSIENKDKIFDIFNYLLYAILLNETSYICEFIMMIRIYYKLNNGFFRGFLIQRYGDIINDLKNFSSYSEDLFLTNRFNFHYYSLKGLFPYMDFGDLFKQNIDSALCNFKIGFVALKDEFILNRIFCYNYVVKCRKKLLQKKLITKEKFDKSQHKFYNLLNEFFHESKELSPGFCYMMGKLYENGTNFLQKDLTYSYFYYYRAAAFHYDKLRLSIFVYYRLYKCNKKIKMDKFLEINKKFMNVSLPLDQKEMCVICDDNDNDVIILPCKHKICSKCLSVLKDRNYKCHICRGNILYTQKINYV